MLGKGTRVSIWMPFEKAPGIRIFKYPEVWALSMNAITKKAYISPRGWPVLASYVMAYLILFILVIGLFDGLFTSLDTCLKMTFFAHVSHDRVTVNVMFSDMFSTLSQHTFFIYGRSPTRSSLKITNCSFRYAAPCLWNELPTDLREPPQTQSPALSPITHGSSSSSPSPLSPLASSLTRSVFHSELKTWLVSKSFPP